MDTTYTLLADLPRLVALAVSVTAALIALGAYLRRRPSEFAGVQRRPAPPAEGIIYRDAPTVRVVDSQRVDRLRKVVRLAPGKHVDILESRVGMTPRFRIALKRIVRMEEATVAHIAVDFGGTAVSCGPLVEEIAFNEFVLPRAARDEPRNCVFHYQESGDALDFMRIKLRGVDADADIAELDVLQVSGHWPAS